MTLKIEGIRQRGHLNFPKKTWWDCVEDDMESFGLSEEDAHFRNKWRKRMKGEGQPANPASSGKWPLKRSMCDRCRAYRYALTIVG